MDALNLPPSGVRHIIALAAHPDDIEIGCGGTLLTLARAFPALTAVFVIATGNPTRIAEAHRAAELFLPGCKVTLQSGGLPDGRLPGFWREAKEMLETSAERYPCDLILAPRRTDAHQDHRMIGELVTTI